jgi:hypothetical protein
VILIVTFDLHEPTRDYQKVRLLLQSADSWAHPQGSVWFIDTLLDPDEWRDKLKGAADKNDEFFVARLRQHWASSNTDANVTEWLKSDRRRW